jgi:D-3-phosphoglycerate dehydrogenase
MLGGKSVGVIGYGKIGQNLVARLANWRVEIQVCVPRLHHPLPPDARHVELRELMATSDVICVVCSLNDGTRGMVTAELLNSMKPEALLVNIARGEIVDEAALVQLSKRRPDIRVALDAYSNESRGPLPADSPMRSIPNAILTPHVIGHTLESIEGVRDATIENIRHVCSGQLPPRLLNPEVATIWQARWFVTNGPFR